MKFLLWDVFSLCYVEDELNCVMGLTRVNQKESSVMIRAKWEIILDHQSMS